MMTGPDNHSAGVRKRLAIFTPGIGVLSETFIRRHILELAPGRTAVVCDVVLGRKEDSLGGQIPVHCTSERWNYWRNTGVNRVLGANWLARLHSARGFLRRHGTEVMLGEYLDASLPLFRVCQAAGIPFFPHAHGSDVTVRLRDPHFCEAYLAYREAAGVITMSRHSKEALVRLGLGEQSVHVVPYGVDVPDRAPEHRTGGPVHCLSVGRMVAKKAPLLVLESFRRALGKTPDMRLTMVGDGPLRDAAVDYVRCHDLQKHAELTGSRTPTEVRALLGSADIFVQHSVVDPETGDSEGLPVAILEAMANGLPVVSTRHAGIPEAVVEHETGFLVEEQDVDAMADAIAQLAASASLRERMGGAGHSRAKEHFTWDLERERLRQILGLG